MTDPCSPTPASDDGLVAASLHGASTAERHAAFAELVRRYQDRLYVFLRRRLTSTADAESITQDALVRAWRKLHTFNAERASFSTWLYTIAIRIAADHSQQRHARNENLGRYAGALGRRSASYRSVTPAEPLSESAHDSPNSVWRLSDRLLDADDRAALWLRYAEDLPIADIARILGRTPLVIRVRLFRARQRLMAELTRAALPAQPALYTSEPIPIITQRPSHAAPTP